MLSAQCFWRDTEYDRQQEDDFFARADLFVNLANQQTSDDVIKDVAGSLLYAAVRFHAFDYWGYFEDRASFEASKKEAIEHYVDRFRSYLEANLESHAERFEE